MLYPISVPKPNSAEDFIGYIDSSGRVVVDHNYTAGTYFQAGLASVCREDGTSGFIDHEGHMRIPFRFRGLGLFNEGLCPIGLGTKVGYLMRSGDWRIEPKFAVGSPFSEGFATVSLDGVSFGYIDRIGAFVVRPSYDQLGLFRNGVCAAKREDKWGYLRRDGSVAIQFQFDGPRAQPYTSGRAGVSLGGRWGFIDTAGDWAVVPQYQDIGRFFEGYAPVRQGEKWGVINPDGRIRVAQRFDDLDEFDGGMAAASLDGKAGYISPEGDWVIEPRFDKSYRFVGDLAMVQTGDCYGYISRNGGVVWTSEPYAMPQAPPFR